MYRTEQSREEFKREVHVDLVVAGGGVAGVIAAVAAAREGVKTVLIQDRPVLGGPSSSECSDGTGKMMCGAYNYCNRNAREAGLVEELRNFHSRRYVNGWRNHWSLSLRDFVEKESNITLLMNTALYDCKCENGKIICVYARQSGSELEYTVFADNFIDATGDGALGYRAGADFRMGREGRAEFNEPLAPELPDMKTMGTSISFRAEDVGYPIKFEAPEWAYKINSDDDLPFRMHNNPTSGYWWLEYGGEINTITDNEEIYKVLRSVLFGMWDHVKNGGDHGAENYAISWVAPVGGKRESRRFMGDYIMHQSDLLEHPDFPDAIAYGGWPIDIHPPEGVFGKGHPGSTPPFIFPGTFPIPFRSLYSRNISNLMMAGRDISVTHVALGSTRLIATCGLTGQAAGTAAALLKKYGCTPRELYQQHIGELRQLLQKRDGVIPGFPVSLSDDLAKKAKVSATGAFALTMETPERFIPLVAIDTPTKKFDPCDVAPDDRRLGMNFVWDGRTLEKIRIAVKNDSQEEKELTLRIKSGFFAAEDIAVAACKVAPGAEVAEFDFNFALALGSYALIFDDEPQISVGVSSTHLPGFERKLDGCYLNYEHFALEFLPIQHPYTPERVVNDCGRSAAGVPSLWMSDVMGEREALKLNWDAPVQLKEVDIAFDTNLDRINLDRIAPECVKSFCLKADGKEIFSSDNNSQRFVHIVLPEAVACSELALEITGTWGDERARVVYLRCF